MFIIRTEQDKLRAIDFIRQMSLHPVQCVEIDDYKKDRTSTQNRAMWSWSTIIGNFEGYHKDVIKNEAVISAHPKEPEIYNIHLGNGVYEKRLMLVPRETKSMTSSEMSKVLDELIFRAHMNQIRLPMSDDYLEMMRER